MFSPAVDKTVADLGDAHPPHSIRRPPSRRSIAIRHAASTVEPWTASGVNSKASGPGQRERTARCRTREKSRRPVAGHVGGMRASGSPAQLPDRDVRGLDTKPQRVVERRVEQGQGRVIELLNDGPHRSLPLARARSISFSSVAAMRDAQPALPASVRVRGDLGVVNACASPRRDAEIRPTSSDADHSSARAIKPLGSVSVLLPNAILQSTGELSPQSGDPSSCQLFQHLRCVGLACFV